MNLFENCKTTTEQGNIGLSKAIHDFQTKGYTISIPLTENQKYDLIVDNGKIERVQVKTTQYKSKNKTYTVNLKTSGGNKSNHKIHYFDKKNCEILFILTSDNKSYIIPSDIIDNKSTLAINKKFDKYIV